MRASEVCRARADHLTDEHGRTLLRVTAKGGKTRTVPLDPAVMEVVRRFVSHKGQRHLPGDRWSATTRSLVGYESWLERDHVMLLDIDEAVTGISSRPFWLFWTTQDGKSRSHAPRPQEAPAPRILAPTRQLRIRLRRTCRE
ncbi:hypothetical protein ACWDTT_22040 [Streptosporangium sandarakinum]